MKTHTILAMWRNRRARASVYSTPGYWDSKADELIGDAVSMWPNNLLNQLYHQEQLALLEDFLPTMNGLTVLDVGCGTGRISRYLAARGAKVTGFDFSAKAIEIARRLNQSNNLWHQSNTPNYRVQSVYELEEAASFDVVVTWGCLTMACKDREQLLDSLSRIRRALKPNGVIALLEPIHRGFLHRVLDMELKEFCDVMLEAGFEVKDVRQLHFWPARFALAFLPWPSWLTNGGYWLGQRCMQLPGFRSTGDYKAIRGMVSARKV